MRYRRSAISRVSAVALPYLLFFSFFPVSVLSAVVTLDSIKVFKTHEWIQRKPAIYFECTGENRTSLPDVQEADVLYSFKGEESWQPLTEILTSKCKRCKLYEELIMSDHVYDEWELCASDFATDGHYTRFKEDEFNVTFLCKDCSSIDKDSPQTSEDSQKGGGGGGKKHVLIPILVTIAVTTVLALISVAAYKYWKKRRRQQEQARFLKLFEDDDDLEGELGLTEMV